MEKKAEARTEAREAREDKEAAKDKKAKEDNDQDNEAAKNNEATKDKEANKDKEAVEDTKNTQVPMIIIFYMLKDTVDLLCLSLNVFIKSLCYFHERKLCQARFAPTAYLPEHIMMKGEEEQPEPTEAVLQELQQQSQVQDAEHQQQMDKMEERNRVWQAKRQELLNLKLQRSVWLLFELSWLSRLQDSFQRKYFFILKVPSGKIYIQPWMYTKKIILNQKMAVNMFL